jgi:hypothetical protein
MSCASLNTPEHKLLVEKKFDMLESLASEAREDRTLLDNANWKIDEFYKDLVPHSNKTSDSEFQKTILLLAQWKTAKLESPTPRIGLAKIYKNYAWKARGSGFAKTVTEEGWKLFFQRLLMAAEELSSPVTKYDPETGSGLHCCISDRPYPLMQTTVRPGRYPGIPHGFNSPKCNNASLTPKRRLRAQKKLNSRPPPALNPSDP